MLVVPIIPTPERPEDVPSLVKTAERGRFTVLPQPGDILFDQKSKRFLLVRGCVHFNFEKGTKGRPACAVVTHPLPFLSRED